MEIVPFVQNYAWGKVGEDSEVACLIKGCKSDYKVTDEPMAELWMGTHPSGPATLKSDGTSLLKLINSKPEYLGDGRELLGDDLPFLLKVLSIEKALSIQVHPCKELAMELHSKFPDIYKDSNHKPEIAIALTPFKALCGFRPSAEILHYFKDFPDELQKILGKHNYNGYMKNQSEEQLRKCFRALMLCPRDVITSELALVIKKLRKCTACRKKAALGDLLQTLSSQYPGDVGIFAPMFLNVLELRPGEAIFLRPNLPHAYISGDCIECSACSDNVVRAGLTSKFKDVETLCKMLDCQGDVADNFLFKSEVESNLVQIFKPPVADFAVIKIEIPESLPKYNVPPRTTASILIVIRGSGKFANSNLRRGSVLFLPANWQETITDITESFLIFQATANLF